ncbi:MAG: hypothetical protein ACJ0DI_01690 [bacterium]
MRSSLFKRIYPGWIVNPHPPPDGGGLWEYPSMMVGGAGFKCFAG